MPAGRSDAWAFRCTAGRDGHMSFTFTNWCHTARVDGQHVYIPAVGWVRMREAPRFTGEILSATVSLQAGRWFIAFQVQTTDRKPALRPGPVIGIDMGVKTLVTIWDGDEITEIANPKPLQAALAELRRVNKAIAGSRKVHGRHRPAGRDRESGDPEPLGDGAK